MDPLDLQMQDLFGNLRVRVVIFGPWRRSSVVSFRTFVAESFTKHLFLSPPTPIGNGSTGSGSCSNGSTHTGSSSMGEPGSHVYGLPAAEDGKKAQWELPGPLGVAGVLRACCGRRALGGQIFWGTRRPPYIPAISYTLGIFSNRLIPTFSHPLNQFAYFVGSLPRICHLLFTPLSTNLPLFAICFDCLFPKLFAPL